MYYAVCLIIAKFKLSCSESYMCTSLLCRDEMSLRERESKNSNTHTDIGAFVAKYQKLVELLFPVYAACDAILYIAR